MSKKLILDINTLKGDDVGDLVNKRIKEFKRLGKKSSREIFKELCFCLLTANYNAERAIEIQKKIGDGFLALSESRLAEALQKLGYRYPNVRAGYIVEARKHVGSLTSYIERDWLVENIKGLGYKEASHFLRNIGHEDFAIIDFHIVDLLERNKLIVRPKTLTKIKYFEVEDALRKIAEKCALTLAELDLYLWYMETGKILK